MVQEGDGSVQKRRWVQGSVILRDVDSSELTAVSSPWHLCSGSCANRGTAELPNTRTSSRPRKIQARGNVPSLSGGRTLCCRVASFPMSREYSFWSSPTLPLKPQTTPGHCDGLLQLAVNSLVFHLRARCSHKNQDPDPQTIQPHSESQFCTTSSPFGSEN